jgi:hypothetical protein
MTNAAYEEGKKIMQKASLIRGKITKAKGNVAKWTKIEDVFRRDGNISRADGARKIVLKAIGELNKIKKELIDLKFPDNDLKPIIKQNTCKTCGEPIGKSDTYCNDICEMVGTDVNLIDIWKNKSLRQLD